MTLAYALARSSRARAGGTGEIPRVGVPVVGNGATVAAAGTRSVFQDGTACTSDSMPRAAGHRDDPSWIGIPAAAEHGVVIENRGVSPVPGLYDVGRGRQNDRASALLCGAGDQAAAIAARVVGRLLAQAQRRRATGGPPGGARG